MSSIYDSLPFVLNATELAKVLGISRAGAYTLMHQETFPTLRIGTRLLVPREQLITWIESQTGEFADGTA